jgi:hypothetical protein
MILAQSSQQRSEEIFIFFFFRHAVTGDGLTKALIYGIHANTSLDADLIDVSIHCYIVCIGMLAIINFPDFLNVYLDVLKVTGIQSGSDIAGDRGGGFVNELPPSRRNQPEGEYI